MPYTPDATDVAAPADLGVLASTAASEFRTIKTYMRDVLLAKNASGGSDLAAGARLGYLATADTATIAGITTANYGINYGSTYSGMAGPGLGISGYNGILLATAGLERWRMNAAGEIGHGQLPTANTKLGITSSALDSICLDLSQPESLIAPLIRGRNASAGYAQQFGLYQDGINVSLGNSRAGNLSIYTSGQARLTIGSSGNLVVNTPSAGGNTLTLSAAATAAGVVVNYPTGGGFSLSDVVTAGNSNVIRLGQSGVVNWDLINTATTGALVIYSGAANVVSINPSSGAVTIPGGVVGNASSASAVPWAGITGIPTPVSTLNSGTYTPTVGTTSNIGVAVPYTATWMRIGDIVTVFGAINIDPILAAGTFTSVNLSLPVASNLLGSVSLCGTCSVDISNTCGIVLSDAATDSAVLRFFCTDASNMLWTYQFSYQVV